MSNQPSLSNPFGDLDDLAAPASTLGAPRKPEPAQIDALSERHNFKSRQPVSSPKEGPVTVRQVDPAAKRPKKPAKKLVSVVRSERVRRDSGSMAQANIKGPEEVIKEFVALAVKRRQTYGEFLEFLLHTAKAVKAV